MLRSVCKHFNKLSIKPNILLTKRPIGALQLKYQFSSSDKIKEL